MQSGIGNLSAGTDPAEADLASMPVHPAPTRAAFTPSQSICQRRLHIAASPVVVLNLVRQSVDAGWATHAIRQHMVPPTASCYTLPSRHLRRTAGVVRAPGRCAGLARVLPGGSKQLASTLRHVGGPGKLQPIPARQVGTRVSASSAIRHSDLAAIP